MNTLLSILLVANQFCSTPSIEYSYNTYNQDSIVIVDNNRNKEIEELTEYAAAQLHYCMSLVYGLGNDLSIEYLENKKKEIEDYLRMAYVERTLPNIGDFRADIIKTIDNLIQQKKDEEIYYSLLEIKRKNEKLNSLNKALSTPMFSGNSTGTIFNVVLTAARAGVDMAVSKNERLMENLQSEHEFDSKYSQEINKAGEKLYNLRRKLYQNPNINLKDEHSLTKEDLQDFALIIASTGQVKVTRLLDKKDLFGTLPDYLYHLGMAYMELDTAQYDKAKIYFDEYLKRYGNEKSIFKIDERLGLICMIKIKYENLSNKDLDMIIDKMLKNLPKNEMAYWMAAMKYCDLGEPLKGYTKLRLGISELGKQGRCPILIYTALEESDKILSCNDKLLVRDMYNAIINTKDLSLQDRVLCELYFGNKSNFPKDIVNIDINKNRELYQISPHTKNPIASEISLSQNYKYKYVLPNDSIRIYTEVVIDSDLNILGYNIQTEYLKIDTITNKFSTLKKRKPFKLFFEEVEGKKDECRVRRDFNSENYQYGTNYYKELGKYELQTDDIKQIVEYCEANSHSIHQITALISDNYTNYTNYNKKAEDIRGSVIDRLLSVIWDKPYQEANDLIEKANKEYSTGKCCRWKKNKVTSGQYDGTYKYFGYDLNYTPNSNEYSGQYIKIVIGESPKTQVILTYKDVYDKQTLVSILTPKGFYNLREN